MRQLRRAIEIGLPVLGILLVVGAVLFAQDRLYLQLLVVLLGLLLIESGVWNLANPILPSERKFLPLRSEVDDFIQLVRQLNRAALEVAANPTDEGRAWISAIREEMIASVGRMEMYAGRTEEQSSGAVIVSP